MDALVAPQGPTTVAERCTDRSTERHDRHYHTHPGPTLQRHRHAYAGRNIGEPCQPTAAFVSITCAMFTICGILLTACGFLAVRSFQNYNQIIHLQNELMLCHSRSHADSRGWRLTTNECLKTADRAQKTMFSVLKPAAAGATGEGGPVTIAPSDYADASDRLTTVNAKLGDCEEECAMLKKHVSSCVNRLHVAQRRLSSTQHCPEVMHAELFTLDSSVSSDVPDQDADSNSIMHQRAPKYRPFMAALLFTIFTVSCIVVSWCASLVS